MKFSAIRSMIVGGFAILLVGCGGDDNSSGVLKVTGGGVDPAKQVAEEASKKPLDKNDPNFEKMAGPHNRNTARDPGVSSGGTTSTAILD